MIPKTIIVLLALGISPLNQARELSKKQLDHWLNNPDAPIPEPKKHRKINEGKLVYLNRIKFKDVMHSENKITVDAKSLTSGWVTLNQCYKNLDAFPAVQVVYKYKNIRDVTILKVDKIGSAKVEGTTVQMHKVQKGATLCVTAKVQSFKKTKTGYTLEGGPFRRKFLDGYFPLRVSMSVTFPGKLLKVASYFPVLKSASSTNGMTVVKNSNHIRLDATFEGVLNTQINFSQLPH